MPRGLTYTDAVTILGGPGPLVTVADTVLGGALSLATAGGSEAALGFFDAKNEMIRLGHLISDRISENLHGLGRYDRSRRLQAAHSVLVVAACFRALDDHLTEAGIGDAGLTRDDQVTLALRTPADGGWLPRLLVAEIPSPGADRSHDRLLRDLEAWCAALAPRLIAHLEGLAVWDRADDRARRTLTALVSTRLPGDTVRGYEESLRRLAADVPEVGLWLRGLSDRAAARGLEALEALLVRATSHRDPHRQRAQLATAYRADLDRPVLGGDAGELVLPALGAAYLDPRFRARAAGPGARPADESWWAAEPRDDLAAFLATHLTTPQAVDAPMILLGQPGAGKSSLTRVLAARLPPADFLVVRVALRDVPADAEIQDQIEAALRATIGESVSWPALAGDADGAMPVVLLDGLDELLQATGVQRSDYLTRVAAFQQREAVLGRPVAVVVTSRLAVADRARVPAGSLAVRLEPFDASQVARWLDTWNTANAGRLPAALTPDVVGRFPDLAAQPLLLLMLALHDATGDGALRRDDASFDTGQLYERLLREFAAREVARPHRIPPQEVPADLVEAELLRLSVVAFAMFHRLRQWATAEELDADLAGLGLAPSVTGSADSFHASVTAGQEMVGRFFFIQRAQAIQDGRTLLTYEFLHATFGEYLVARLVVEAIRDAASRARARTLHLGRADDDDLLRSLIGYTALTARSSVLPFATDLLRRHDVHQWLIERLRTAVTRPLHTERRYAPIDKRADYWMATYSFNLMLMTLACGSAVRASDLFLHTTDPAGWLRSISLMWRAAIPSGIWLDTMALLTVTRVWTDDGRRDLTLTLQSPGPGPATGGFFWSRNIPPGRDARGLPPGSPLINAFSIDAALTSMELSNTLIDDMYRHAIEPVRQRFPALLNLYVVHGPDDAESVAHSLLAAWLASALDEPRADRLRTCERAVVAASRAAEEVHIDASSLLHGILETELGRLDSQDVRRLRRVVGRTNLESLHRLVNRRLTNE